MQDDTIIGDILTARRIKGTHIALSGDLVGSMFVNRKLIEGSSLVDSELGHTPSSEYTHW